MDLRKIDALVAEMVLGHDLVYIDLNVAPRIYVDDGADEGHEEMPFYSSDIAAAWAVMEKLQERFEVHLSSEVSADYDGDPMPPVPIGHMRWRVDLREHYLTTNPGCVHGIDSAPLAICLAALKAGRIEL